MTPAATFNYLQFIDSDFILLPAHLEIEHILLPLLRKSGRLAIIQNSQQAIIGCLDSFGIARAYQQGLSKSTLLGDLELIQPLLLQATIDFHTVFEHWSADINRPIIIQAENGNILGHVRASVLVQGMMPQILYQEAEISRLTLELSRRDEYLGIVSHDLRAPLAVIQLAVDFLQIDEHAQSMNVQAQSFIERIKRNSNSAQFLVNGLLESVRTHGGLKLNFDQVILSSIVDDVVQSINLVAHQKKQTIVAKHLEEIKVYLDIGRIRQVLENLLMNAVKYSPLNAQINAQTSLVERDGNFYAVLQVTNPGARISPEEGRRLFTPFVQGNNAEPLADGVGLGLSIVQKVIELHEGMIEVGGDNPDEVCLQVFLPNATSVLSSHKDKLPCSANSVLVVDDDEGICEFTETGLTAAGFQVFTASDGARAFSIFQRHRPSLVISDIRMNRVDGFELLAKIRESSPQTPVILCSGFYAGLEKDLSHSALKPDMFVDKPFRLSELVINVKRLLGDV